MSTTEASTALVINGVEVRFTPGESFILPHGGNKYVDVFNILELIERLGRKPSMMWDPPNLLVSGPKGNGKSLLFKYLAEVTDTPYLTVDCSEETKERHLKGGFVAKSGETPFVMGSVSNAIHAANQYGSCMLVFEEINALSPQMQKELNPITWDRRINIPELSTQIGLAKDCVLWIGATMNYSVYGGTYELNPDLKSRFIELEMPYPDESQELEVLRSAIPEGCTVADEVLLQLIRIAQQTRQDVTNYQLSTRDLVQLVQAFTRVGWIETLFLCAQKFSDDDRQLIISRIKDITKVDVRSDLVARAAMMRTWPR